MKQLKASGRHYTSAQRNQHKVQPTKEMCTESTEDKGQLWSQGDVNERAQRTRHSSGHKWICLLNTSEAEDD